MILNGFPPGVIALIVTIVAAMLTEITSNTATATIFLPILAELVSINGIFVAKKLSRNYRFHYECAILYLQIDILDPKSPSYHGYGHSKHAKRNRKCTTYPDSIVKDLDLEPNEIQQLMKNKTWRKFLSAASTIPSKDDK